MKELTTAKVTPEAWRLVGIIAATTGERKYEVLERILKAELDRLKAEGKV